jgi:hypothetical protein
MRGMEKKYELREITVGELVAEGFEREASLMPPSYKEQADLLRQQAALFRDHDKKVVRILREIITS